jgi:hypothetical protein
LLTDQPVGSPLGVDQTRGEIDDRWRTQLGRGRRRRRPKIRHVVDECPIGFVPNAGNDRDAARENGANDAFVVETPEVVRRTPAAGEDDHLGAAVALECPERGDDARRCCFALNRAGRQQELDQWIASAEDVLDVVPDRSFGRRDHADARRHGGDRSLAVQLEQALRGELLAQELDLKGEDSETGRLEQIDVQLVGAVTFVNRNSSVRGDVIAGSGRVTEPLRLGPKDDALELAVSVAKCEVTVARTGNDRVGDLALDPEIGEQIV